MNKKKSIMSTPGMGAVITAFVGVVILMAVFTVMNTNFISKTT